MERKDFLKLVSSMPLEAVKMASIMTFEAVQNSEEPMDADYYTQIFQDCADLFKQGGE